MLLAVFIPSKSFSANFFWVNGTGTWSDYANHWATSSGGSTFHIQIPSPVDDVFFDDNSSLIASDTVMLDSTLIYAKSLNYTGTGNVFLYSNNLLVFEISTTINLNPGLSFYAPGSEIRFISSGIHTLNTGSDTLFARVSFRGSGEYNLNGDLNCYSLDIQSGKFHSNNHHIWLYNISTFGNPEVFFGSSEIYAQERARFYITTTFYPIHAENATIYCRDFEARRAWTFKDVYCSNNFVSNGANFNNVEAHTFVGYSGTYNDVKIIPALPPYSPSSNITLLGAGSIFNKIEIDVTECIISGNLTSDTLIILPGTYITVGDTLNINSFLSAAGNCSGYTSLNGSNGILGTINMNSGQAVLGKNYFNDIRFLGTVPFNAASSFTTSTVSGVTISAPTPKKLFWINGTGDWNDASHWSTISGTSQDNCIPTEVDTVVFDNNSFFTNDTVTLGLNTKCKTFIWSSPDSALFNTILYVNEIFIHQSLIINNPTTIEFDFDYLHFISDSSGNKINTNYALLYPDIDFSGSGEWAFQSAFKTTGTVLIKGGTLKTNGNTINAGSVSFDLEQPAAFLLDTSLMEINIWDRDPQPFNLNIDADMANFKGSKFLSSVPMNCNNFIGYDSIALVGPSTFNDMESGAIFIGNCNGHNINILDINRDQNVQMGSCNINKLELDCESCILNAEGSHIDSLISVKPGQNLNIDRVIVDGHWKTNGSCSGYITISGKNYPDTNNIQLNGTCDFQYMIFKGLTISGNVPVTPFNSIFDGPSQGLNISSYTPRTLFWVNGDGNWGDNNHWSSSSGGIGGECIPTKFDDVIFDSQSSAPGNFDVYLNHIYSYCNSLHFIRQGKINPGTSISPSIEIYGNLETDSLMSLFVTNHLISDSGTNYINSRSQNFGSKLQLEGNGAIELIHSLKSNNGININVNSFYTRGYQINCAKFLLDNSKILNVYLDTSTINSQEFQGVRTNNAHYIDGDSSNINCTLFWVNNNNFNIVNSTGSIDCDTCNANLLTGKDIAINNSNIKRAITTPGPNGGFGIKDSHVEYVQLNNSDGNFTYNSLIDTLIFNMPGQDITVNFNGTVANHMEIISNPGFPTRLQSNTPVTINYTGDTLCTDFIYLKNINLTGSGVAYAGINSFDLGGNSGWNFLPCPIINEVEDIEQSLFTIYPNPVSSTYFISCTEINRGDLYFTLYNMFGQIIDEKQLNQNYTEMNGYNLSKGIYTYQIRNTSGSIIQKGKIVFN
ncbi:MAG TPA: T9SS type A sorting domain-containing protein [Saprospiraceae bacterium]|nr:T9SS type A sorting domain-containing protein [Saprospiraceae bacterium]